jgi:tetratricopeptide (TPR) repeat protein
MKRILFITLFTIATFALPGLSGALAQTRSPRPNSTEDFFNRGVARYQKGDLEGAMRDFDRAIDIASTISPGAYASNHIVAIAPEPSVLLYNRGVTRYGLRDWGGAIADLDESLTLNPLRVLAWIKLGNARFNKGDLDEAIKDYEQVLRLDPRSVMALNNRGLAWQNKGKLDAALSDYARALELDPRLTVALNNRAGIKHDRGDLLGALNDYNRAIEIDPKLALLYCNRGVTRKALGDLKGALADYNEAIRLNPDFNLAYFNRSAALRAMGKGFEAEQDFIRSLGPGKEPEVSLEPPIEGVPATKATNRKIQ